MGNPGRSSQLVRLESVQDELKLTDAQKKRHTLLMEQQRAKVRKAREDYADVEIFRAAGRAIAYDLDAAILEDLKPGQRERLEQIQLQERGPLAFDDRETRRRLKLSSDQADEIEAIVNTGMKELEKVSSFPIDLNPGDIPQTEDAIRGLVVGLEFQFAKEKASHLAGAVRAGVMLRIAKVLTAPQRAAYRKMRARAVQVREVHAQDRRDRARCHGGCGILGARGTAGRPCVRRRDLTPRVHAIASQGLDR